MGLTYGRMVRFILVNGVPVFGMGKVYGNRVRDSQVIKGSGDSERQMDTVFRFQRKVIVTKENSGRI